MSTNFRLKRSFRFAFAGIKEAFKGEPNFKIHLIVATIVIIPALILNFSAIEWAILVLTIGLVLILELVNTSLEALVDLVSPEIRDRAKIAKDTAAAAVLISALASILIAFFLFLPKILGLFIS